MDQGLKNKMLVLARRVLENEIYHSNYDLSEFDIPEFEEKRGLFVTLHIKSKLRGCIGRLEAKYSIYRNIIDLSKAAAFDDHRFKNLTAKELPKVRIEISLLSKPLAVAGDSTVEKVMKIKPKKDGVIISTGSRNATFLPQVWDSLPIKEDFISDLCQKAGLAPDFWQLHDLEISTYQVEHFEEE
jgi:AmmeMemoRadiSam system protein A